MILLKQPGGYGAANRQKRRRCHLRKSGRLRESDVFGMPRPDLPMKGEIACI